MHPAEGDPRRRFSIAHFLLLIPWIALVIDAWSPIGDNSFLWHIRAGSLQLDTGSVITTDPFSFTAGGEAWLTQSWLAELIYGRLEAFSGLGFVPVMMLVIMVLTFLGIGLLAYRSSNNVLATGIILILSTVLMVSFLVPRPVIFSYLLSVLVILSWERRQTRWLLPFLFWLWASVHGSFFIGLAYVGLRLLSKKEWKALPVAIASGLATLLTAHGLGVIKILTDFVAARPYLSLLSEWRTPELLSPVFFPFFVGIVLIMYGATRGRIKPLDLIVVVPFFAIALTSLRSVPPAWISLVVLVGVALSSERLRLPARFGIGASTVFAGAIVLLPFLLIGEAGLSEDRFPIQAAEELDVAPVFHNDVVGGYLIWSRGPALEVFIDDRAELYQERMEEFVDIRVGKEPWEPVFERYGISQALLAADEPMVGWLEEAGWAITYGQGTDFVIVSAR